MHRRTFIKQTGAAALAVTATSSSGPFVHARRQGRRKKSIVGEGEYRYECHEQNLADGAISPGRARALLGTPGRTFQEGLAKKAVSEGLTVRAVEDLIRQHLQGDAGHGDSDAGEAPANGSSRGPRGARSPLRHQRRLRPPGVLGLESSCLLT